MTVFAPVGLSRLWIPLAAALLASTPVTAAQDLLVVWDPPCADSGSCHFERFAPPGDGEMAQAGAAVALWGPIAAVGVPGEDLVRIYRLMGGIWQEFQTLPSPDGPGLGFGLSLELSPTRLFVGAPGSDAEGASAGAVYVYELDPPVYTYVETLTSPDPAPMAYFGADLAWSGSRLLIGEPFRAPGGRAHVFAPGPGGGFAPEDVLEEPGTVFLGLQVAADGPHLYASDPGDSLNGSNSGAVHSWYDTGGSLNYEWTFRPLAGIPDQFFGARLEVEGTLVVAGSPGDDSLAPGAGSAYVFRRKPSEGGAVSYVHDQEAKLVSCTPLQGAAFGGAIAIDGTHVAVGSFSDAALGQRSGQVYTFRPVWIGTGWQLENELRPADGLEGDAFGMAVALDEQRMVVGAVGVTGAGSQSGAVYMVSLSRETQGGGQCPAPFAASTWPLFGGKAGSAGVPLLELTSPLIPGEMTLVRLSQVPVGNAPILLWTTNYAPTPFDGGNAISPAPLSIPFPVVGGFGQVGLGLDLPDAPELAGLALYFQSVSYDPGASGQGLAFSNAVGARIGY